VRRPRDYFDDSFLKDNGKSFIGMHRHTQPDYREVG
jgi:hypothetical protein